MKYHRPDICDKCGKECLLLYVWIHAMQEKNGMKLPYKTTYVGEKNIGCNPCSRYDEKELASGYAECGYKTKS